MGRKYCFLQNFTKIYSFPLDVSDIDDNSILQNATGYYIDSQGKKKMSELLRVNDLIKLTGWSKHTIYRKIKEGRIPYLQPEKNGTVFFQKDAIDRWLKSA